MNAAAAAGMVSLGCLFDYKTVKYVVTPNRTVGVLYRIFQLVVAAYLIGWVFLTKKKYQMIDDTIESSVKTRVRGVAIVNTSDAEQGLWGPEDYVVPQQGDHVLLVMTNFLEIPNQTLGHCPENPSIPNSECTSDKDCRKGEAVAVGNGIKTGICDITNSNGTCEIYGWCPVEMRKRPDVPMVSAAENFTLYIRNFIRFSKFDFSKGNYINALNKAVDFKATQSNVRETTDRSYLKICSYNETTGHDCPVFRLGDIVHKAGHNFQEMAVEGGSIGILIDWQCDLDKEYAECHPHYNFTRLNTEKTTRYKLKYVNYFKGANGEKYRNFYTVFGIHFDIMVSGMAGKFDIIPTIVKIGSSLALMGAGAYLCDIILLYTMKRRTLYRVSKYETVIKYENSQRPKNGDIEKEPEDTV